MKNSNPEATKEIFGPRKVTIISQFQHLGIRTAIALAVLSKTGCGPTQPFDEPPVQPLPTAEPVPTPKPPKNANEETDPDAPKKVCEKFNPTEDFLNKWVINQLPEYTKNQPCAVECARPLFENNCYYQNCDPETKKIWCMPGTYERSYFTCLEQCIKKDPSSPPKKINPPKSVPKKSQERKTNSDSKDNS